MGFDQLVHTRIAHNGARISSFSNHFQRNAVRKQFSRAQLDREHLLLSYRLVCVAALFFCNWKGQAHGTKLKQYDIFDLRSLFDPITIYMYMYETTVTYTALP